MIEVGAFEAKNKLSALLDRVEQGEEIIITRHGRPVARLVPNTGGVDRSAAEAAWQRMRDRAKQAGFGKFDWETLKAERDASRP
jgi:prevent-host-death family protein